MTIIQQRRGTAALWTSTNPIMAAGEFGVETDTLKMKMGNGTSTWTALSYITADLSGYSQVGHTHTTAAITDMTAIGDALATAVDAPAARAAIGAGTSSLVIGTTGSTAKAGNWFPAFSEVTGTLSTAQLPPLAINEVFAPADQAAMLALSAQRGDVAIRVDNGKTYILSTDSPGTLADWKQITAVGDVTSVAGRTGAVVLTKTDVGLANVDNTSDANKPVSTAQATSIATKENTIAAGTTAQYWRGDKSWQTLDKTAVGLANVDNTSDVNKPVSSATTTQLNLKAPLASPTFTGTVSGVTATMVGLGNVTNTSDANKPVSTAQQTALDLKANLASPTFTGTVTLPSTTNGLTKSNVGLANVDNTADTAKPVSTAQQTALNLKANLASPTFTGTVGGITYGMVGAAAASHTHTSADIISIDGGAP
jgi:hypothetical protein